MPTQHSPPPSSSRASLKSEDPQFKRPSELTAEAPGQDSVQHSFNALAPGQTPVQHTLKALAPGQDSVQHSSNANAPDQTPAQHNYAPGQDSEVQSQGARASSSDPSLSQMPQALPDPRDQRILELEQENAQLRRQLMYKSEDDKLRDRTLYHYKDVIECYQVIDRSQRARIPPELRIEDDEMNHRLDEQERRLYEIRRSEFGGKGNTYEIHRTMS